MQIQITAYTDRYVKEAVDIWNQVVEDGVAFPQTELLTEETGDLFFKEQSYTGLAVDAETGHIAGLYILHPNNVGRCGHICNASYAVRRDMRGQQIGEALVRHCLQKAGFVRLGTIPGGFLMKDGHYEDIVVHYIVL